MRSATQKRGQSLVIFALGMIVFIAFVALAVDGSRLLAARRKAKMASDAGAMAAAYAWTQDGDYGRKAKEVVGQNGFVDGEGSEVLVEELPKAECEELSGGTPLGDHCKCFRVTVKTALPSAFAQLLGFKQLDASTSSVARACKSTPLEYGYVVRTKKDLVLDGGGGVMAWGRIRADEDLIRSGWGHAWSFGGFPIPFGGEITSGERIVCNGGFAFCNPMMNMMALGPPFISTVADHVSRPPLAQLDLPEPEACSQVTEPMTCAEVSGMEGLRSEMFSMMQQFMNAPMPSINNFSSFTGFGSMNDIISTWEDSAEDVFNAVEEGEYDDHCLVYPPGKHTSPIRATGGRLVFFLPGEHCLTHDLKVDQGVVMGHDVTFYFENGSGVRIESQSQVFLDAGTFGRLDFGGMLFYNPSRVQIGAVSGSMLVGSIYAPEARCNFAGQGMVMGWAQIICNEAKFTGGFNAMLMYNDDHLYHIPAELSLIK